MKLNLAKELKKEFFGINEIIDEVCDLIDPWSIMPDCYNRPLIANLWGMTGTGKTTLVRKIAELLKIPIIEIDIGAYSSDSAGGIDFSRTFFDRYYDFSNKPCIILIDEVHLVKTINETGGAIDRGKLRGFWSLLSDGKIIINARQDKEEDAEFIFEEAEEDYREDMEFISKKAKSKKKADQEEIQRIKKKNKIYYLGWGTYFLKMLCKLLSVDYVETRKNLNENFIKTIHTLKEKSKNVTLQPQLNFCKSAIFISGNLDNLYLAGDNFDPDLDLEKTYRHSREITISDVKDNLTEIFRLEQIGRFGNNHFIYPALNKKAYQQIINYELGRIKKFYKTREKTPLNLSFHKSVGELLYREGVVPAQGARSVLSTVGSLLDPVLIRFYVDCHDLIKRENSIIKVSFDKTKRKILFKMEEQEIEYRVKLKFDELRQPKITERSTNTAVHEAGHVLCCVKAFGIIPNRATAYTLGSSFSGLVDFIIDKEKDVWSFDRIKKYIQVCLAGYVAEKMVFGDDFCSNGAGSDIGKATSHAADLVERYGYDCSPVRKVVSVLNTPDLRYSKRSLKDEGRIEEVIKEAEIETHRIMSENSYFLKALSEDLLNNSMLGKEEIKRIMKETNTELGEVFSHKDSFFDFFNQSEQEERREKSGSR